MPTLKFLPEGRTIEVPMGQDLLTAALEHGIELAHACGGHGACSSCHVYVEAGMENTSPSSDLEQDQLDLAAAPRLNSRLACQTRVYGDVVISLPHRRK